MKKKLLIAQHKEKPSPHNMKLDLNYTQTRDNLFVHESEKSKKSGFSFAARCES